MSQDHLLRLRAIPRLLYPADIQRAVLTVEAAHTTHIVPIITKLVSRKAILGRVGHGCGGVGEGVQVFAFPAVGTAAARKEEAYIFDAGCVGAGEACVLADVAARLGFGFAAEALFNLRSGGGGDEGTYFE